MEREQADPAAEAAALFRWIESERLEMFHSHQMVSLSGRAASENAITPPPPVVAEIRTRLREILHGGLPAVPSERWYAATAAYAGVELVDPFDDDRPLVEDDVPSFSGRRSSPDIYVAVDGRLLDMQTSRWLEAPGLDIWLLGVYLDAGGTPHPNGRIPRNVHKQLERARRGH